MPTVSATVRPLYANPWTLLKTTAMAFIEDGALSRGASIAFYTITSMAPVLVIVVAIAGIAFGEAAAQNAVAGQISGMMGQQAADMLQSAIKSAGSTRSGVWATIIGLVTLLVTASGVFGEMQSTLNHIWKTTPHGSTVMQLVRARLTSLTLVAALGVLLMISLIISAVLSGLTETINAYLPFATLVLSALNLLISYALMAALFAAIYKVLPDRKIEWPDVTIGALVTAALFEIGKTLIGLYLGRSAVASSYGAAGTLLVMLLWIYYSAQIFLLGAEFTKVYAGMRSTAST